MNKRITVAATAFMVLAACQPPLIYGERASGVRALDLGMTYGQVVAILGPQDGGNIDDPRPCLTWYYDAADPTKHIDARFDADDGRLLSARANFRGACHPFGE